MGCPNLVVLADTKDVSQTKLLENCDTLPKFVNDDGTTSLKIERSDEKVNEEIENFKKNYYKLSVTKEYEVTAYVTYKRLKGEPESAWKIYSKGTSVPVRKNCTYNVVMVKKGDPNDRKKESKSIV